MLGSIKYSFIVQYHCFGIAAGDTGYFFDTEEEAQCLADFLTACSIDSRRTYHIKRYEQWVGYEDEYYIQEYGQFKSMRRKSRETR